MSSLAQSASSRHVRASSRHVRASSRHVSASSRHVSASSRHVSASSRHVRASSPARSASGISCTLRSFLEAPNLGYSTLPVNPSDLKAQLKSRRGSHSGYSWLKEWHLPTVILKVKRYLVSYRLISPLSRWRLAGDNMWRNDSTPGW